MPAIDMLLFDDTQNTMNIYTSETAMTNLYTATKNSLVFVQSEVSNLNTAASATINLRIEHLNSEDASLAPERDYSGKVKLNTADATIGLPSSNAMFIKTGEKLKFWFRSTNANDTNVSCNVKVIDLSYATLQSLENTDFVKSLMSHVKGRIVKTGNVVEFYDTDNVTLLYTLTYASGERTREDG